MRGADRGTTTSVNNDEDERASEEKDAAIVKSFLSRSLRVRLLLSMSIDVVSLRSEANRKEIRTTQRTDRQTFF
jgi:hypothetical protein